MCMYQLSAMSSSTMSRKLLASWRSPSEGQRAKASLHTRRLQAKIRRLRLSANATISLGIPPLKTKIMLESNPLKSRILVRRLAVGA